ncbi:MAG: hypothetical protein ACE5IM_10535, partial [Nitrospinota bacterium]
MPENEDDARPRVQVVDRRHWARKEGEGEAAGAGEEEAPSLLPTYVERLEARAREQEERLKAFLEEQKAENAAFRERVRREA